MEEARDPRGFYRILVALETDATRYYGPDAVRPAVLGSTDAEQMLAHIAADLRALLPGTGECSLIAAGALYDQTQILRPRYPVFEALEGTVSEEGRENRTFRPALVSIGAESGAMPLQALQPEADIPLGLLQLLPVVLHGPADLVQELGQAMEYRFLEEGQLSAHAANWLQSAFGIAVTHGRLMTLTDLIAMLRLQLEHFGFLPLWELLDAALSGRHEPLVVTTASGQSWEWRDGAVHTDFQTFDHWAREGGGAERRTDRLALAGAYGDWTRELRQYLTTLRAHSVPVQFHSASSGEELNDSFLAEVSGADATTEDNTVTHHSFGDLGTVAVTAVTPDGVRNYYPLRARGLNDIQRTLRNVLREGHSVAWPGSLLYDEESRRLRPDREASGRG